MSELQKKILEILVVVKDICEKNNIKFYAISGTCLGAVRHRGFIPWDDDLDIAMPDEDYFRFLKIAKIELPYPLQILTPEEMPHSPCLFSKVHNVETTFIEPGEMKYPDSYKGVFVDIFPLNGLPDNNIKRNLYKCSLSFLARMNEMRKIRLSDIKKITWKAVWLLSRCINLFLPINFWTFKWKNVAFKYRFSDSKMTSYADSLSYKRPLFRTEWFEEGVKLQFENITIPCPKEYDKCLKSEYGDYMILPPENERIAVHGSGIVDLEKSFINYIKRI